jgi:hypothetical protein
MFKDAILQAENVEAGSPTPTIPESIIHQCALVFQAKKLIDAVCVWSTKGTLQEG